MNVLQTSLVCYTKIVTSSNLFKKGFSKKQILSIGIPIAVLIISAALVYIFFSRNQTAQGELTQTQSEKTALQQKLSKVEKDLETLKNQDQVKRNDDLQKEIENINKTFKKTVVLYESFLKLEGDQKKTDEFEKLFAQSITLLSERNYASAEAVLSDLDKKIQEEQTRLVAVSQTETIPQNIPVNNTPPGSGFSRQTVSTELGNFVVNIVTADLNSTRVIVDTASDSTCTNDCPVLSLGDYVARSGAFAGINGSYFCPASYPSCAGKTNSFDTLLMNKNKVYFNSDNNVYSNVPAVAFYGNTARFMGQSSEWGRDTGVDAVIANQPLLLLDGQIVFNGDGEPKRGSKGARSFIGSSGSTVYIGVVQNATVAEVSYVLKAMGIQNALNLDSGGSTALWSGGYKVGPGRNIPNAILFVRK